MTKKEKLDGLVASVSLWSTNVKGAEIKEKIQIVFDRMQDELDCLDEEYFDVKIKNFEEIIELMKNDK